MNRFGHHPLAGQCIGLFGRRGSGTSTCAAFLARALTESGYAVRMTEATPAGRELGAGGAKPVTLLDFEAGDTDLPPRAAATLNWAVVVIDPSCAGVGTAVALERLLEEQCAGDSSNARGAVCVLNKVADADTEFLMWQHLLEAGLHAVASIPDEPDLRQAGLTDMPLENATARAETAKIVRALEQECASAP